MHSLNPCAACTMLNLSKRSTHNLGISHPIGVGYAHPSTIVKHFSSSRGSWCGSKKARKWKNCHIPPSFGMNFRNTLSRRKERKKINSLMTHVCFNFSHLGRATGNLLDHARLSGWWTGAKRGFGRLDPPMAPIDKNLPIIRHCVQIILLILRINSAQNFLTNLKLCLNY